MKPTIVTAIECISTDGRSLLPMVIWLATTPEATRRHFLALGGITYAPSPDILTSRSP